MSVKVAVLGGSGETGRSIISGLLESDTKFDITALARPSSIESTSNNELKALGVKVAAVDLNGPEDDIVRVLEGIDVVISAVNWQGLKDQIPLANASKKAGVKRFIPCNWGTAVPPRGMMPLRDLKEDVLDHVKRLYLPYTVVEVGWWYQLSVPKLSSGKLDYIILAPENTIAGTGDLPWARTDLRDIGRFVARIIVDDRTLNKGVFIYGGMWSQNYLIALVEKLSGEKVEVAHATEEQLLAQAKEMEKDPKTGLLAVSLYYLLSQGIYGHNTPDYARYLGLLIGNELYPDLKPRTLESFFQDALDGKGEAIFKHVVPPTAPPKTN